MRVGRKFGERKEPKVSNVLLCYRQEETTPKKSRAVIPNTDGDSVLSRVKMDNLSDVYLYWQKSLMQILSSIVSASTSETKSFLDCDKDDPFRASA